MKLLHTLLPLALLAAPVLADASTVLYRQNFGNSGSAKLNINSASVDWRGNRAGATGPVYTIGGTGGNALEGYANSGVWFTPGAPNNLPNVNSTTSQSDSNGFIYTSGNASVPTYSSLLYQNIFTIDRSAYAVESISWTAAATTSDSQHRLAIRLGTVAEGNVAWYVSDLITTAPGGLGAFDNTNNFHEVAAARSVDMATANWYSFDWGTDGYTIGESAQLLPEGDITAFGIYAILSTSEAATRAFAFDTFTVNVNAIPEPGTLALLATVMGGVFCIKLRRKS